MEKMFTATLKEFGKIDIVINNAGTISPIQSLMDVTIDDWNHVIDVNLKGVFMVSNYNPVYHCKMVVGHFSL